MIELSVGLQPSYPIFIGENILDNSDLIDRYIQGSQVALITQESVARLYLKKIKRVLETSGLEVLVIYLEEGEENKNSDTLNHIYKSLLENNFSRDSTLVALGGGIVGDIAGFAAATYQRGVRFIQIPTTLLSQVDSSVGGKTAINHELGKNMIGAFYQPKAVIADTATLKSLPEREIQAGLAEVIKYGLIMDIDFFEWLEKNMGKLRVCSQNQIAYAIKCSCESKTTVVVKDELESGFRAILNFGHTFGHAIETGSGYGSWLHGEAVAVGMVLATELSVRLGFLDKVELTRVRKVLLSAGLPVEPPKFGGEKFLELMRRDKKVKGNRITLVLLKRMGEAFVTQDFPMTALVSVLEREEV